MVTVELEMVPGYEDAKVMEQARCAEAWFTARVPGGTSPGFKSFAVSGGYGLKVTVQVEVGGKEFVGSGEVEVRGLGGAE
ncbi:hypothetical protein NX059_001265 [Plenodomus lindquistii]|nr:hypothetical protein NX059_001265 [Plenodomus lindquistii]